MKDGNQRASTGWETMLEGLMLKAGFRSDRHVGLFALQRRQGTRPRARGTNALAFCSYSCLSPTI